MLGQAGVLHTKKDKTFSALLADENRAKSALEKEVNTRTFLNGKKKLHIPGLSQPKFDDLGPTPRSGRNFFEVILLGQ